VSEGELTEGLIWNKELFEQNRIDTRYGIEQITKGLEKYHQDLEMLRRTFGIKPDKDGGKPTRQRKREFQRLAAKYQKLRGTNAPV
jgi:hypothetical protein